MAQQPDDSGGKSWERPWSTDEMRQNADNWTLAADAGLLKRLQQFSQEVLSHTHSTEKALDSLLETLNTTNTNITNVTNDFLCLANTQFLESRVYDDDDVESPQETPAVDPKQEPQGEVDLLSKVKSALSIGVNLLETMFEPADPNSGLENDIVAVVKNRTPKNPYSSRPLPHLIGSAAFMADDDVGLVSSEKDEPAAAKAPAVDELSMYSDESILTSSVKRNNMDDDSSNTSFCLGDDTPVQTKKPSRDTVSVTGPENDAAHVPEEKSFADELAGKLANMISPSFESRVPPPLPNDEDDEPAKQNRPSKKKGDMFGLPPSDDEDDALFSGRSGLFSGGRGLFDDMDDSENNPKEIFKDKAVSSSTPQPPPVPKPKINSDLFDSNSADEDNDDLFAVPAKKEPARPGPARQPVAPPKPLSIGDVISQAAKRNLVAPAPKPVPADRPEKAAETVPTPSVPDDMPPPVTTPTDKKIPVGGRSMFGAAGLPIPKEALRRRPSSSSSGSSEEEAKNEKAAPNSGGGLFSADEDDLFQAPAPSVSKPLPSAAPPVSKPLPSAAAPVSKPLPSAAPPVSKPPPSTAPPKPRETTKSPDLFATPTNSGNNLKTAENKRKSNSLGLFDEDGSSEEDNLFSARPSARPPFFSAGPPPLTKSEEKPLTKSEEKPKKVSLFDDSDSGDEEFLFSSASSAGSRRSQASVDIFNSSVPAEKKTLKKGLFGDDLFGAVDSSASSDKRKGLFDDVFMAEPTKGLKKGLFDEDLFAPPAESSEKPKKSLFDDNLFSDGPAVDIFRGANSTAPSATAAAVDASAVTVPKPSTTATPAVASATTSSAVPSAPPATTAAAVPSSKPATPSSNSVATSSAKTVSNNSSASSKSVSSVPASASETSGPPPIASSSPAVSASAGDSLFDDDDDDLFSVSKPPPLLKPKDSQPTKVTSAATEDLFSGLDTETKDRNSKDLFGDAPEDDLFSETSRVSLTYDNNSQVPVDDLFGTDEGDGDIFVTRKPTLTISDSVVEKVPVVVPIVEKPKPELKVDAKPTPPKPTPPRTLDIRNTTDPNVVSSFDDDDEEDLFKPPPVQSKPVNSQPVAVEREPPPVKSAEQPKPVPPKPVPSARNPSVSTPEDEAAKPRPPEKPKPAARTSLRDEGKPQTEKPPVAQAPSEKPPVAQAPPEKPPVAQAPPEKPPVAQPPSEKPPVAQPPSEKPPTEKPPVAQPPSENPPSEKPPVGQPPEKPPVASVPTEKPRTEKPPVAQPPEKPPVASVPTEKPRTEKPPVAQPPSEKPTVAQPSEKPAVAQPPSEKPPTEKPFVAQSPTENSSVTQPPPIKVRTPLAGLGLNINPLALLPGAQPPTKKTPGEEPVGFDQPMENSSTLRSAQKERVRGSKRRPPSRRARQDAAKVVDHTGADMTSPSSVMSPSTDEDDLFGVPQDLPPDPPPDRGPWPFDGGPILSPGPPEPGFPEAGPVNSVDEDPLKPRAETSSGTDTDADATEDQQPLFAFVKKKPKEAHVEPLFSQAPPLPTKDDVSKVRNSLTDEDADDDLFKPSAAVKKIADLSGPKTWRLSDDDDDDDLFSTGASSLKAGIANSAQEVSKELRVEEKKPISRSEPPAVSRNETSKGLSSQPPKKTEKSLFDDDDDLDDDDLFSSTSTKPPPLPASKGPAPAAVQKKQPSPTKWKDDDLFDDPLSGR